jgi:hypothetical protein
MNKAMMAFAPTAVKNFLRRFKNEGLEGKALLA